MPEQVVALLRGINVGKNKRVAMADLRTLLTELGYLEPRTLLNSGNAVFGVPPDQVAGAAAAIERAIADRLHVQCAVLTRTGAELEAVIAGDPLADVATDPSRYLVGFLSHPLPDELAGQLQEADYGADRLRIVGTVAYLWCASGILASPLPKLAWHKLAVDVTTRNWNTVLKLAELVRAA